MDHSQKTKKKIQKFKETGDTKYIYRNELDKACFQHYMAYGGFKDLVRRKSFDKVLRDKAFNIAKNLKYHEYQRGLASMVYTFFDKKSSGSGIKSIPNKRPLDLATQQLANELHKPIIKKFEKRRVYSSFKDNIWDADLADMQVISKFIKGIPFLLCFIDIFSKCAWVVPLKDRKDITIVNAFQKVLNESDRKPNKIWVDKGSEFYNSSFKKWLKDNDIEMYLTHNEEKLVNA